MSQLMQRYSGMRLRAAACHPVLLSLFVLLFGTGATAFGDSRVGFNDPLSNFLISGEYYMWGWALFDTQPVSSVTITVGNNSPATAHYGDPRPDVCNNGLTTWVGCNAGTSNVGWDLTANTAMMTQGPGQTVTVLAAPLSGMSQSTNVTVDQPPTMVLTSTPAAGSGNGKFTFTVNTATSMQEYNNQQPWINGMIATSLGSYPACSFSYYPDAQSFALINNAGNGWLWGTLGSGLSNAACTINPDSSYAQNPSNLSGALTLDITFNSALLGNEQIWMITADDFNLQSGWTYAGQWNTRVYPPAISSFSPASGPAGTVLTISGSNFQPSPSATIGGMTASVMGSSPTSVTAMVPAAGAGMKTVAVTVNGMTATASQAFQVMQAANPPTLSPTSGPAYTTTVTISANGTDIGTGTPVGSLSIGGLGVPPASWTPTQITFAVPYSPALQAGALTVMITPANGANTGMDIPVTTPFTLTPGITMLSRSSGPPEMGITITGTNFGAAQTTPVGGGTVTSNVYLNGTLMPADSAPAWSDTTITLQVPAAGETGTLAVTVMGVTANGQVVSTTSPIKPFTVTSGLIPCSN